MSAISRFIRNLLRDSPQYFAGPKFACFELIADAADMMEIAPYSKINEGDLGARRAALAGTRELIRESEFEALCAALVSCNAIPGEVMGATLRSLAAGMIAKAKGDMETEWLIYPAELLSRAKSLEEAAAKFATGRGT